MGQIRELVSDEKPYLFPTTLTEKSVGTVRNHRDKLRGSLRWIFVIVFCFSVWLWFRLVICFLRRLWIVIFIRSFFGFIV